jgi:C1A family cysteine protease
MPILSPLTWKRGHVLPTDKFYAPTVTITQPPKGSAAHYMGEVLDQLNLGACTAHGYAAWAMAAMKKAGVPVFLISRLFQYLNERLKEGTVSTDAGAIVRDAFWVGANYGIVDESLWPYDVDKFAVIPPANVYAQAKKDTQHYFAPLDPSILINQIKIAINHGQAIVYGFDVFSNFEAYESGVLELPSNTDQYLGGHCVAAYAYDDSVNACLVRNSWNTSWGINGDFWVSYNYLASRMSADFWTGHIQDAA